MEHINQAYRSTEAESPQRALFRDMLVHLGLVDHLQNGRLSGYDREFVEDALI